jgi:hypothetical protein
VITSGTRRSHTAHRLGLTYSETADAAGTRIVVRYLGLLEGVASIHAALPVEAFERSLHSSLASAAANDPQWTMRPRPFVEEVGYQREMAAHFGQVDELPGVKCISGVSSGNTGRASGDRRS